MLREWIGTGRSNERLETWEQRTNVPLLILAAAMLPLLVAHYLVHVPDSTATIMEALEWVIWAIFTVDLGVRVWFAEQRLRYLRRHWIDVLIVVLPFLRPLRLLRLLWFAARFTNLLTRRGAKGSLVLAVSVMVGATAAVWFFERGEGGVIQGWETALWWTLVTMATGDGVREATTVVGKVLGVIVTLLGFALLGMVTATIAAAFVEKSQDEEQEEILERLEALQAEVTALRLQLVERSSEGRVEAEASGD